MTRASLAGWTIGTGFVLLAIVSGRAAIRDADRLLPEPADPRASIGSAHASGLLYGRVTMTDGVVHEGRLRFGGDEEALWTHFFNGAKADNPWAESAPASALVRERPREFAGIEFGSAERRIDLDRPFMVRFGDIARIDAERRTLAVTLRSGDVVTLDRFEADDFADGIRVWDDTGMVDLDEWSLRSVEFLPTPEDMTGPAPLRGTVRTPSGEFSGLLQWDREASLVSDRLEGVDGDGARVSIPFASVTSLQRTGADALRAALIDGGEVTIDDLAGPMPHRGIYVDDARYGRVLVSWDAVESLVLARDADAAERVAGFESFTGGTPLQGTVTTRAGDRVSGRLVYDLDESRSIETLDAPWSGVDYTIPFGLVAAIEPIALPTERDAGEAGGGPDVARVTLRSGEVLRLETRGDLGPDNAGVLVFTVDGTAPTALAWADVARIDLAPDVTGR